jgi:hypothetical protein
MAADSAPAPRRTRRSERGSPWVLRRAAHRTLLWLAMSGTVVGIYAVVVIVAAALVPDHRTWCPSALAAAVAALLLIPLRDTVQRAVTRIVYGRWHEPYEVLGERLEAPPPTSAARPRGAPRTRAARVTGGTTWPGACRAVAASAGHPGEGRRRTRRCR